MNVIEATAENGADALKDGRNEHSESETAYPPEVERLLWIGDPREKELDYERMGFMPEHVPSLISMAVDDALHDASSDGSRVWAPVHAWRALRVLKPLEAAAPLVSLLWRDDDWVGEEVPEVLAEIGEPALGPLFKSFDAWSDDESGQITIAETIGRVGLRHPECRNVCVKGLTERLMRFAQQDADVNAFLILSLVELKAVESLAVIEAAYAAGRVDPTVLGDDEDIRIEFGLQEKRKTPPPRTRLTELYEEHHDMLEEIAPGVGGVVGRLESDESAEPYVAPEKVGRNDPCPCGSGKKYKKCCGKA